MGEDQKQPKITEGNERNRAGNYAMRDVENGFIIEKEDLVRFGESSHDKNPLHLEENYAKTTVYGENVVFGMLGVTHALEKFHIDAEELSIRFISPLFMDHVYQYQVSEKKSKKMIALLENDSSILEISMRTPPAKN